MTAQQWLDTCSDGVTVGTSLATKVMSFGPLDVSLGEPGMFVRAASFAGTHYGLCKGHDTNRVLLIDLQSTPQVTVLGLNYGNTAHALRVSEDRTILHILTVVSKTQYRHIVMWLNGSTAQDELLPIPSSLVGTSQGFLDCQPDGMPVWTDPGLQHPIVVGGVPLRYAVERQGTWLGQRTNGASDALVLVVKDVAYLLHQGLAYEPHLTVADDGVRLYASYRVQGQGGRMTVVDPSHITFPPLSNALPIVAIPTLGRACWWGGMVVYAIQEFDDYPNVKQNCVFVNAPVDLQKAANANLKIVPTLDVRPGQPNLTKALLLPHYDDIVAMYCSASTLVGLKASVDNAKKAFPKIPTLAVCDRVMNKPLPKIKHVDWPCFECYVEPGETPAQMEARIAKVIVGTLKSYSTIGLIQQSYDRGGTTPPAYLPELQAVPLRLAKRFKQVTIGLNFALNRVNGLRKYPELQMLQDQGFSGIPGHPPIIRT